MAQIMDVLAVEKQRTNANECLVIHLYQEGTFLRAYEWSAWLCVTKLKDFKVTHRALKNVDGTVAFIGFPVTSLENYTPATATLNQIGEKCIDLVLPEIMFPDKETVEEMTASYEAWKESLPLTETGKKSKDGQAAQSIAQGGKEEYSLARPHIMGIMQQILAFPVESKSPIDSMLFLADIKQKLAGLM